MKSAQILFAVLDCLDTYIGEIMLVTWVLAYVLAFAYGGKS